MCTASTYLAALSAYFVEALHGQKVVDARVEADFVHNRDVRVSGSESMVTGNNLDEHHFVGTILRQVAVQT